MQTYSVPNLREHAGELIRGAEAGDWAIVFKHGTPVIIVAPFHEVALEHAVRVAPALKLCDDEVVTQRQAAKIGGGDAGGFHGPVHGAGDPGRPALSRGTGDGIGPCRRTC